LNKIIINNQIAMFYVTNNKIYWLRRHWRFIRHSEMLEDKVLVGPNDLKLKKGFNYFYEVIK